MLSLPGKTVIIDVSSQRESSTQTVGQVVAFQKTTQNADGSELYGMVLASTGGEQLLNVTFTSTDSITFEEKETRR